MNYKYTNSDSLIGSLCREMQYIRTRIDAITNSLKYCQNKLLISRLEKELKDLSIRIKSISLITKTVKAEDENSLALDLLHEIINRSLTYA